MHIGFDLDNTIAIYDDAIQTAAQGLENLPVDACSNKIALSTYLKKNGRNAEWTEIQGELYGPLMEHAFTTLGWKYVVQDAIRRGDDISIISHRTKTPFGTQEYDLHAYANAWIEKNVLSLFQELSTVRIYLFETLEEKVTAINTCGCDMYVDDLESVINHSMFPSRCRGIILNLSEHKILSSRHKTWREIRAIASQLSEDL